VQVFNAITHEEKKFSERVDRVLTLARREAVASGIFFGSTGWSGNVALLAFLGYGGWISQLSTPKESPSCVHRGVTRVSAADRSL